MITDPTLRSLAALTTHRRTNRARRELYRNMALGVGFALTLACFVSRWLGRGWDGRELT